MRLKILIIIFAYSHSVTPTTTPVTLAIDQRIRLLKHQLRNSLHHPPQPDPVPNIYDESNDNSPLLPILDDDKLKKNDRYLLKTIRTKKQALRTVPTAKGTRSFVSARWSSKQTHGTSKATRAQKPKIAINVTNHKIQSPSKATSGPLMQLTTGSWSLDIFYRRNDFPYQNTAFEWMHCSELVTPFIKGAKKDLAKPKKLNLKSNLVTRLLHLLSYNTTGISRSEKRSIMYQVSKLSIRLFSWDASAINGLMMVIMAASGSKEKPTLKGLKMGVQAIMNGWMVDLSNTTSLLLQAKIFRPPCVQATLEGSSKFVRGSTIATRPTSSKSVPETCRRTFGDYGDKGNNCLPP